MPNDSQAPYDRGVNVLRDVYAGDVVTLPEGTMAFNDVMVQTLFDQVWRRAPLDVRSRRLLLMGVIASHGQVDTWKIQARAALKRGELNPEELRETLIMLAPYAGYPNISALVVPCEEVIGTWIADGSPGWVDDDGAR
ncbi:MAG: carboxymuconolactone decarboxylase family protein [Acidimicrobiales bacterium]|jgi:4-carboxymuconolactone decarboxylase